MDFKAFDSHCHIDLLFTNDSQFPDKYIQQRCAGLTWSFADKITTWKDYPAYWNQLKSCVVKLREQGLPFYYLVGIHPRCIPDDLTENEGLPDILKESLQQHINDPLCRGLGELGLDSGEMKEEKILKWQLSWAIYWLPADKRIGIHTPRKNKRQITEQILNLLALYKDLDDRILIDHLTSEIWDLLRQKSYTLGLTLQKGKASIENLMSLLTQNPRIAKRLMINSDSANMISKPYFNWLKADFDLDKDTREMLLWKKAIEFFNI